MLQPSHPISHGPLPSRNGTSEEVSSDEDYMTQLCHCLRTPQRHKPPGQAIQRTVTKRYRLDPAAGVAAAGSASFADDCASMVLVQSRLVQPYRLDPAAGVAAAVASPAAADAAAAVPAAVDDVSWAQVDISARMHSRIMDLRYVMFDQVTLEKLPI